MSKQIQNADRWVLISRPYIDYFFGELSRKAVFICVLYFVSLTIFYTDLEISNQTIGRPWCKDVGPYNPQQPHVKGGSTFI